MSQISKPEQLAILATMAIREDGKKLITVSYLQRKFRLMYNHAARLMDELVQLGVVSISSIGNFEHHVYINQEGYICDATHPHLWDVIPGFTGRWRCVKCDATRSEVTTDKAD